MRSDMTYHNPFDRFLLILILFFLDVLIALWHDLRPAHVVYQIPECAPINVPATTTTRSSKNVNQTTGFTTEVTSRSGVHQTPDRLTTSQPNHWVEPQSSHSLKPPSSRTMKESFMVIDLPLKQHPELGKIYDGKLIILPGLTLNPQFHLILFFFFLLHFSLIIVGYMIQTVWNISRLWCWDSYRKASRR